MIGELTERDLVWAAATLLFVAGCVGLLLVWWRTRPVAPSPSDVLAHYSQQELAHSDGLSIRGVDMRSPGWRIVPRRPYDWALDGD